MTKAVIICDDTLRAIGLKHLLESFDDMQVTLSADETPPADADIYFISPDSLVKLHRFFMPRMRRTVVLTREPVHSPVLTLDTLLPEAQISSKLRSIVSSLIASSAHPAAPLSEREIEVLRLIARGNLNKEIAAQLNISLNTVLSHRKNIISKLGVKSPSGLTVYAMMNGIM